MKSIKCGHCGLINFADSPNCRRCSAPVVSEQGAPAVSSYQQSFSTAAATPLVPQTESYAYAPASYSSSPVYVPPTTLRTGHATASLVLGIIGCFSLGLLGIGSVVGLLLGISAAIKAKREPELFGAKGTAIGGIVTNSLALFTIIPVALFAAIAIPNILAAQMAANEATAINHLRNLGSAEYTYQTLKGDGRGFGTDEQLVDAGLLSLDDGIGFGYKVEIRLLECEGSNSDPDASCARFEAVATPLEYGSSGRRSFYVSDDYVIRAADKRGREATREDKPLQNQSDLYLDGEDRLFD